MIRKLRSAPEGAGLGRAVGEPVLRALDERRPKRKRLLLAALVPIFLALGLMTAGPASADSWGGICCANGNVYLTLSNGQVVGYAGNVPDLGAYANRNVRVENHGYNITPRYVNLFYASYGWYPGHNSAWACIDINTYWQQGSGGVKITFSRGPAGSAGKGQSIWNNVATIQWVGVCQG